MPESAIKGSLQGLKTTIFKFFEILLDDIYGINYS